MPFLTTNTDLDLLAKRRVVTTEMLDDNNKLKPEHNLDIGTDSHMEIGSMPEPVPDPEPTISHSRKRRGRR